MQTGRGQVYLLRVSTRAVGAEHSGRQYNDHADMIMYVPNSARMPPGTLRWDA
jgi:hypothetical protein